MDFTNLLLPRTFTITPKGILSLKVRGLDVIENNGNVEYSLNLYFGRASIIVDYYGEDGTYISGFFNEEDDVFFFEEDLEAFNIFEKRLLNLLFDKKKRYVKNQQIIK